MNFFINGIVHVFILLVIISAFFFVYVSQLSKDRFQGEIQDLINNNLTPALAKADKDKVFKKILQQIDLDRIQKYYGTPDEASEIENGWLFKTTLMIIGILLLVMVMVVMIVGMFCRKIPFGSILIENAIMFTFIGAVEITFFLIIAKNYIPTKPSLLMQTVYDSLKTNFET